jgi:DNA-directed RNA polymerase subunit beta'
MNVVTVRNKEGHLTAMNRNGELAIMDANGREREKYSLVYGAKLLFKDGDVVEKGTLIAEWDPYSTPIITEASGTIRFEDVVEGVTMQEQFDSVTGPSHKVITETKSTDQRPKLLVVDTSGNPVKIEGTNRVARYMSPVGADLVVNDGDAVEAGDTLAKIHRETSKTKDITGGLPRVAELFEAANPRIRQSSAISMALFPSVRTPRASARSRDS